jgi:hypothetical protein
LDFTRTFAKDHDGFVCAAIFLDIGSYSLWVLPLTSKNGREAARAVTEYRQHVRSRYRGVELQHLRAELRCSPGSGQQHGWHRLG